ncbi:reverse transcriptase [Gossypium australe]|uniref:Reverse transcriptase n=1 Tax=Gossypium australe TaxID=47621 RepID=A0A5B6V0U4_9ROSI|nr:reverse transcriptase [Gossypium australe]
MIYDLEEIPIGVIDGKKRQRKNVFFEKVSEISNSEEKEGEGYLAYQKTLSVTTRGIKAFCGWFVEISMRSSFLLKRKSGLDEMTGGWTNFGRFFGISCEDEVRRLWESSRGMVPQRLERGSSNVEHILEWVNRCIMNEMNQCLIARYERDAILNAVKTMTSMKAPGPDGFRGLFFQTYWHIVGYDVGTFCLKVLNGGMFLDDINYTHIVLIPKNSNPNGMKYFCPISLCLVLYKIISKVVCINEAQCAFVLGRLITNNILLAYEILEVLKREIYGKKGQFTLKLDMSKAYDRVE